MEINPKMIAQILEENTRTRKKLSKITMDQDVKQQVAKLLNKEEDPADRVKYLEETLKHMKSTLEEHFNTLDKIIICNGEYEIEE